MTAPTPLTSVAPGQAEVESEAQAHARDALDEMGQMMTGTQMLKDEPGALFALRQAKASPQQAQSIDQFMQGLDAEKQVNIARASAATGGPGSKINLTYQQRMLLTQNGVPYNDVLYTNVDHASDMAAKALAASGGKQTVAMHPNGTLSLDANHNVQLVDVQKKSPSHHDDGWFHSIGSFAGHLEGAVSGGLMSGVRGANRAVDWAEAGISGEYANKLPGHQLTDTTDEVDPTAQARLKRDRAHHPRDLISGLNKMNQGWHWAEAGITGEYANKLPGHQLFDTYDEVDPTVEASRKQDLAALGYPDDLHGLMAAGSANELKLNLTGMDKEYTPDKVSDVISNVKDPVAYRKSFENDPAMYTTDANGTLTATPELAAKLAWLKSPEYEEIARKLAAKSANVGDVIAGSVLNLDPIHHSKTFKVVSALTNFATAGVTDPTFAALKGVAMAKSLAVGVNGINDADHVADTLTRKSYLPWINNLQRGWQRAIDLGTQVRDAHAAGDAGAAASATAQFNAELPGLAPAMDLFSGGDRVFKGFHTTETEINAMGKEVPRAIFGHSDGIRTIEEAAAQVRTQDFLSRLVGGRAGAQASLMPGALSAFGYRKVKGLVAGSMTARSFAKTDAEYRSVLTRAAADPELQQKVVDSGMLKRMTAAADDAVLSDGTVIGKRAALANPSGLASQDRSLYLSAAGKGDVLANLRQTGDPLGLGLGQRTIDLKKLGVYAPGTWINPTAIAYRAQQAVRRLTTALPRSSDLSLADPQTGDKIMKFALTYMGRGDANYLKTMYDVGDGATKKSIIEGVMDQVGHSAGLGHSATGQGILDAAKIQVPSYTLSGNPANEIEMNGARVGLVEGQTRGTWRLPSFDAIHQASNKVGLWEATMSRPMSSTEADAMMSVWKMGKLFKPSTATRNMLEAWLKSAMDGVYGDAVQAHALLRTPNKELWARGRDLDSEARVAYQAARDSGNKKLASQIAGASRLSGEHFGLSKVSTFISRAAPLAYAGKAFRAVTGKTMTQEDLDAFLTLPQHDMQASVVGYSQRAMEGDLGFHHAAAAATDITKDGHGVATLSSAVRRALDHGKAPTSRKTSTWSMQSLDDTLGTDRYANALRTWVDHSPETAKAVVAHLEGRAASPDSVDGAASEFQNVITAMENEKRLGGFGGAFFEDADSPLARRAVTPEEQQTGKEDWANRVISEYKFALTGQNGEYQSELGKYITEHGKAPDSEWLNKNITGDARPSAMMAPEVMALPAGGIKQLARTLQDVSGAAYQWMVERPLQRTTTAPIFMAGYISARKGLNAQVERMVENGTSRAAAENLAMEMSVKNAWVRSEQIIDDPGLRTQFDTVARNFFPFSRATQAMIRRWGTSMWQNPAEARKMMLAYESAEQSGLIYDNEYGEASFTYPGSGVMGEAMQTLAKVPGFENIAAFPLSSSMTGQVLMSVPGADNPLRMGMGPMISFPLREMYKHLLPTLFPGAGLEYKGLKLDQAINGQIGAGDTGLGSLALPTAVDHFYRDVLNSNDRDSALASSMVGAIGMLAAAGLIPPPNASAAVRHQFLTRLKTQQRNHLYWRYAFGQVAPAAPSLPGAKDGAPADYAWSLGGVKNLSDEFHQILNEVDGNYARAEVIFTTLHPDSLSYKELGGTGKFSYAASGTEEPRTKSVAKGAYLPATEKSLQWMQTHSGFVGKYGSVAAYFLPSGSSQDPFSDAAYQSQIELGLRLHKTPEEFLNGIYVSNAESTYYPQVDQYDARIAAAKQAGDTSMQKQLTTARKSWEKEFKNLNPLFGQKLDGYTDARVDAEQQLGNLRQMVQDKDVPDGRVKALGLLLQEYDGYNKFKQDHPGSDSQSVALRSAAFKMFNDYAAANVPDSGLTAVYNGVFRVLDNKITKIGVDSP